MLLELLECTKSDPRFWYTAIDKNRQAPVEPPDTTLLDGLLGTVPYSLVLASLLVQLQLSLDILGGVGDADLNTTGDTPSYDAFQCLSGG